MSTSRLMAFFVYKYKFPDESRFRKSGRIFRRKFAGIALLYYLCTTKLPETVTEAEIIEREENISEEIACLLACENTPYYDIDTLLKDLQICHGAGFINQLKLITGHPSFTPIEGESHIYSTGGEKDNDYPNLLNAARKAVEHGYKVFILPNPKGFRTPDFIFERKGVYKTFDLKTITGNNSVGNRLTDSIGQTNRVLLNMSVDYNPMSLARSIRNYFESNTDACEVLVFKNKKQISITRKSLEDNYFLRTFVRRYIK